VVRRHFVFPADPLEPRAVDSYFAAQRDAFVASDFTTSLVSDATFESGAALRGVPAGAIVVYRGWMIDERQYRNFAAAVERAGAVLLTSPEKYLLAHHLPNWYPLLANLTPETIFFPADADLSTELRNVGWPSFFIKDWVKSLKTSAGSMIADPTEAQRVVDDMRKFRGTIEGGICVRRVERFRPDSERRSFVIDRQPFAPAGAEAPSIVHDVASRIDHPFFSVDVALNEEGALRVVEIGDGQVSDPVGWSVDDFVALWR